MDADRELGNVAGARERVIRRGAAGHPAGAGEHSVPRRAHDRRVDARGNPEIVGGDCELAHAAVTPRSGDAVNVRGTPVDLWCYGREPAPSRSTSRCATRIDPSCARA